MFLSNDFVLGNELHEKMNFSKSVISIARAELADKGFHDTIIKLAGTTAVNINDHRLPKYVQPSKDISFTRLTDRLPIAYLRNEVGFDEDTLKRIGGREEVVSNVRLWVFEPEFVETIHKRNKNTVFCDLTKDEYEKYSKNGSIVSAVKVKNNRYLGWYFV